MTEAGYPLCIVGALSMRWLNRYYQTSNIVDIVGEHPGIADHPKSGQSSSPKQSGPANIRFLCSIKQLQMSDQRRDIVNLFSSFLISVKIEFNPRPNSDHDPDQPWRLGVSREPQLWDRSHEIHFDIIKDCRGLVSGAEVIRIREMSPLMS